MHDMIGKSIKEVSVMYKQQFLVILLGTSLLIPTISVKAEETTAIYEIQVVEDKEVEEYIDLLDQFGTSFEDKKDTIIKDNYIKKIKDTLDSAYQEQNSINAENPNSKPTEEEIIEKTRKETNAQKKLELEYYVVQNGDTLESISKSLGLNVNQLIELNHINTFEQLKSNANFELEQRSKLLVAETNAVFSPKSKYDSKYILFVGDLLVGVINPIETSVESTKELSELDHYKINKINSIKQQQFNISQDQINRYISNIQNAKSLEAVDQLYTEISNYSINLTESSQQITVNPEISLNELKDKSINQLLSMNISQEQYNMLVAEIKNSRSTQELDKVMSWAQNLATENNVPVQVDLTAVRQDAKNTVSALGLNQDQIIEVNGIIDSATTENDIYAAINYAKSLVQ